MVLYSYHDVTDCQLIEYNYPLQILSLKSSENKIQKEVNEMNLELMEVRYSLHHQELESSQRLFGIPGQHSTPIGASTSGSTLSLIDRFHASSKTNVCVSYLITESLNAKF